MMKAATQHIAEDAPIGPTDIALLAVPDKLRARYFAAADAQHQKDFGQFLTPPHIADLMAGMFRSRARRIRLLDAGAGIGILSAAFIRRQLMCDIPPAHIEVTAYELDQALIAAIEKTFEACRAAIMAMA